jgi:hypothetical protein
VPLILQSRIYRADLRANPNVTYAYGDNEERRGLGGQAAEMRGEPNAVGIATLKAPGVFWKDGHIYAAQQMAVIDADMEPLFEALKADRIVVLPLDGVGTGLADLANRSPTTFAHLQKRVAQLKQAGGL